MRMGVQKINFNWLIGAKLSGKVIFEMDLMNK